MRKMLLFYSFCQFSSCFELGNFLNQQKGLIALGLFKDYNDIRNSPAQQFGIVQPGDIKYKDVNGDGVVDNGDITAIGATTHPNLIDQRRVDAPHRPTQPDIDCQQHRATAELLCTFL